MNERMLFTDMRHSILFSGWDIQWMLTEGTRVIRQQIIAIIRDYNNIRRLQSRVQLTNNFWLGCSFKKYIDCTNSTFYSWFPSTQVYRLTAQAWKWFNNRLSREHSFLGDSESFNNWEIKRTYFIIYHQ